MSSAGEEQDRFSKPKDEAIRNMLGMSPDDAPPAAGELLFNDYEDGGGVDDLLGIVRDPADHAANDPQADADTDSTIDVDDAFDDDLIVFEEEDFDEPAEVSEAGGPAVNDGAVVFTEDDDSEVVREKLASVLDTAHHPSKPTAGQEQVGDDSYWNELDRWVWDDEAPESAPAGELPDSEEEDEDDEDDEVAAAASGSSSDDPSSAINDETDEVARPHRRRRGRRGRRGRGRGSQNIESASEARVDEAALSDDDVTDEDDLTEILFEDASEDFVSVSPEKSPDSQSRRRRTRGDEEDDPEASLDESERGERGERGEPGEPGEDAEERPRRGHRGGRRGRSRRSESSPDRRPSADVGWDDDDDAADDAAADDAQFEFDDSDNEDDAEPPRKVMRRRRPSQLRDVATETQSQEERPRRSRGYANRSDNEEESRDRSSRREREVTPDFRDIPSWEEAIASLSLKSPGVDHADRRGPRGRSSRRRRT